MPTNVEVAMELDRMAEETEGLARQERLVKLRETALQLMKTLRKYDPILVGASGAEQLTMEVTWTSSYITKNPRML